MSAKSEQTEQRKANMLEALEKCRGVVSEATEKVTTGRTQHYTWLKEDKAYRETVNNINEAQVDRSESLLMKRAEGYEYEEITTVTDEEGKVKITVAKKTLPPDVHALKTHLAAKGRERGYGTKIEVGGMKDAPPISIEAVEIVTDKNARKDEGTDDKGDSSSPASSEE